MAAIINGASQIKITNCTFLKDRAQHSKHVKVQVIELKIATFFLMLEKCLYSSDVPDFGTNFMGCPTLQ